MKAYAARALVLTVLLLLGIIIIRGGLWLLGGSKKTEETFQDARIVEPAKRDPDCKVIVLDAGHGGRDQGTSAGNVLEKDINLSMVKKLAELLDDDRIDILLTRETDTKIGLDERAEFANHNKADLFIRLRISACCAIRICRPCWWRWAISPTGPRGISWRTRRIRIYWQRNWRKAFWHPVSFRRSSRNPIPEEKAAATCTPVCARGE